MCNDLKERMWCLYCHINNADASHIIKCCKGKLKSSGKLEDGTKLQWSYIN